jgi:division protein CdvB (Snf7/Vps24/ESCRT-III family)
MSEQTPEQPGADDSRTGAETTPSDDASPDTKLVPVGESIKYRRRAQQAEGRLEQLQQKLDELETQLQQRQEEIATAEAQRDEAAAHATRLENRLTADRKLAEAGVVDIETASVLLGRSVDFSEPVDDEALDRHVEQLLTDKPFLTAANAAALPAQTASARVPQHAASSQLADAARRAATSGDRRDVAEYLRLRRRAAGAAETADDDRAAPARGR